MPNPSPLLRNRPKREEVLRRRDARKVLDADGRPLRHGEHIRRGKQPFAFRTRDDKVVSAVFTPPSGFSAFVSAVSAAAPPIVSIPPEPTDLGQADDFANNPLWTVSSDRLGRCADIHQWNTPFCWGLSVFAGLRADAPWVLRHAITKGTQGYINVRLAPWGQPVRIYRLTPRIGYNGTRPNPDTGAIGACMLEKAVAIGFFSGSYASIQPGWPGNMFTMLDIPSLYLNPASPSIATALAGCLANRMTGIICTGSLVTHGAPIIGGHAYTVYAVLPDGTIIARNPWGIDGVYQGNPTPDDSLVAITPEQFYENIGRRGSVVVAESYPLQRPVYDADINYDGIVDLSDLTGIANRWQSGAENDVTIGDLNLDGYVDVSDLTIVGNQYGDTDPLVGVK